MTIFSSAKGLSVSGQALLNRALVWWLRELASLLPSRWRKGAGSRVEVMARDGMVEFVVRQPGKPIEPGVLDMSSREANSAARRLRKMPVWFLPPADAVLTRSVQIPRSALRRFGELIVSESDRWTSFPFSELYLAWRATKFSEQGRAAIELRFIPRAAAAEALRVVRSFGLEPSRIALGGEVWVPLNTSAADASARRRRLSAVAVAAASLSFLAIDWSAAIHQRNQLQEIINRERRALNQQRDVEARIANVVTSSSDGAEQSGEARDEFLASLSEALPASDWLTEIAVRGSEATLRGYTAELQGLVKALEPLAKDRTVLLQGEVAVDKKLNRSRFAVALRLPK